MTDTRKLAIVTGAAGGIGTALLEEFAGRGFRLLAVDLPTLLGPDGTDPP